MSKPRMTGSELDARLKFILGIMLGTILLATTLGILYALIFVTQPVTAQSENDKMFFNVLGSVATFITGTLAGLLIGRSGAQEMKDALESQQQSVVTEEVTSVEVEDIVEDVPAGKDNAEMPEEQPIDEDWDKD
jgi:nitrate reductase gamma subunit